MNQNDKKVLNDNMAKLDLLSTKLKYCREILISIKNDNELLPIILEKMVLTSNDFYQYLIDYQNTSITVLDEMLLIISEKKVR